MRILRSPPLSSDGVTFPRRADSVGARYFVVGFTAFLLCLIWSAVAFQLRQDRATVLETARVNTRNLDRAYAEHVSAALQPLDEALLHVKLEYEHRSATPDALNRALDRLNVGAHEVPIGITDRDGNIVASNLGSLTTIKPSGLAKNYAGDRDYFKALTNDNSNRIYVGAPIISRVTGKTALALSRRLNKPDGSFAGVVFASFDPDFLSGFFGDLAIGKQSSFSIVGNDMVIRDMIRGSGRATDLVGKTVPNPLLVSAVDHAPNGDYEAVSALDSVPRLYSYRSLADYRLIVLASAALPEVMAGFNERKLWMLGAAAALTLILIAVAAFQFTRITETRRYERAINRSNEKLERAQRLAAVGSFEHDASTGIAEWSGEMYRILGIEKTGAIPGSETLLSLIHPDDRDMFREHRARELAGKPVPTLEYRVIRPDGEERIVRRESMIDLAGGAVRRYGTLQDITALRLAERRERELERQLLHSQKLEALGTLAGGIAHDLNNTLTPVMALSKIAARRLPVGDENRDTLETIFAASEQARDLVKRILSFSRREKAKKEPIAPTKIVNDALTLLRATIPSCIRLDATIADVPPILADSSQMHQVITNLVTNAAQAIAGDGKIAVTLERVAGERGEAMVRLSVADTGKGMDAAIQERIFEPFFTTKDVGQGTGLGLSIIAAIVNDHGGRIEVTSAAGKGTRFDVYLPALRADTSAAA